jgi:hypothetical protein
MDSGRANRRGRWPIRRRRLVGVRSGLAVSRWGPRSASEYRSPRLVRPPDQWATWLLLSRRRFRGIARSTVRRPGRAVGTGPRARDLTAPRRKAVGLPPSVDGGGAKGALFEFVGRQVKPRTGVVRPGAQPARTIVTPPRTERERGVPVEQGGGRFGEGKSREALTSTPRLAADVLRRHKVRESPNGRPHRWQPTTVRSPFVATLMTRVSTATTATVYGRSISDVTTIPPPQVSPDRREARTASRPVGRDVDRVGDRSRSSIVGRAPADRSSAATSDRPPFLRSGIHSSALMQPSGGRPRRGPFWLSRAPSSGVMGAPDRLTSGDGILVQAEGSTRAGPVRVQSSSRFQNRRSQDGIPSRSRVPWPHSAPGRTAPPGRSHLAGRQSIATGSLPGRTSWLARARSPRPVEVAIATTTPIPVAMPSRRRAVGLRRLTALRRASLLLGRRTAADRTPFLDRTSSAGAAPPDRQPSAGGVSSGVASSIAATPSLGTTSSRAGSSSARTGVLPGPASSLGVGPSSGRVSSPGETSRPPAMSWAGVSPLPRETSPPGTGPLLGRVLSPRSNGLAKGGSSPGETSPQAGLPAPGFRPWPGGMSASGAGRLRGGEPLSRAGRLRGAVSYSRAGLRGGEPSGTGRLRGAMSLSGAGLRAGVPLSGAGRVRGAVSLSGAGLRAGVPLSGAGRLRGAASLSGAGRLRGGVPLSGAGLRGGAPWSGRLIDRVSLLVGTRLLRRSSSPVESQLAGGPFSAPGFRFPAGDALLDSGSSLGSHPLLSRRSSAESTLPANSSLAPGQAPLKPARPESRAGHVVTVHSDRTFGPLHRAAPRLRMRRVTGALTTKAQLGIRPARLIQTRSAQPRGARHRIETGGIQRLQSARRGSALPMQQSASESRLARPVAPRWASTRTPGALHAASRLDGAGRHDWRRITTSAHEQPMRDGPIPPAAGPAAGAAAGVRSPQGGKSAAFRAALRHRHVERPRSFPAAWTPLARSLVGSTTAPQLVAGPLARAVLAGSGVSAATIGRNVYLSAAPDIANPHDRQVVAHEFVHVAAPSSRPRFHGGPLDREERHARRVGRLAATSAPAGLSSLAVGRLPVCGGGSHHHDRTSTVSAASVASTASVVQRATGSEHASTAVARSAGTSDTASVRANPKRSSSGAVPIQPSTAPGATNPTGSPAVPTDQSNQTNQNDQTSHTNSTIRRDEIDALLEALEDRVLADLERRGGRFAGEF